VAFLKAKAQGRQFNWLDSFTRWAWEENGGRSRPMCRARQNCGRHRVLYGLN